MSLLSNQLILSDSEQNPVTKLTREGIIINASTLGFASLMQLPDVLPALRLAPDPYTLKVDHSILLQDSIGLQVPTTTLSNQELVIESDTAASGNIGKVTVNPNQLEFLDYTSSNISTLTPTALTMTDTNYSVTVNNSSIQLVDGNTGANCSIVVNGDLVINSDQNRLLMGNTQPTYWGDYSMGTHTVIQQNINDTSIQINCRGGHLEAGDTDQTHNYTLLKISDADKTIELTSGDYNTTTPTKFIVNESQKIVTTWGGKRDKVYTTTGPGEYIEPHMGFVCTEYNTRLYFPAVSNYIDAYLGNGDGWYCHLFNYGSNDITLEGEAGNEMFFSHSQFLQVGSMVIKKYSTVRISLVFVLGQYGWSVSQY